MSTLAEAYGAAVFVCLVATYLGALTFGAAAVAPLAVRLLPAESSAVLLRAFWVRFHRLGAGAGGLVTAVHSRRASSCGSSTRLGFGSPHWHWPSFR